jgi:hypothetical protein
MKVGIVGSRSRDAQEDWELLDSTLKGLMITEIVSGGCSRGGDRFAEMFAERERIPILIFKPQPNGPGRREYAIAAYARNMQIAETCDILVAVWDGESKGTKHTITYARKQGKRVIVI